MKPVQQPGRTAGFPAAGILVVALLVVLMTPRPGVAQSRIHWLQDDFPPHLFNDPAHFGQGPCDAALIEARERLDTYDHVVENTTFSRFKKLMKINDNYCYSCLLRTAAREKYIVFSEPFVYLASNELVARASDAALYQPFLEADGSIDLTALLESGTVAVSVSHGRSFGQYIDSLLLPYKDSPQMIEVGGSSSLEKAIRRLFTLGAYDAILGYAPEIVWHARKIGIPMEHFRLYPIKGLTLFDVRAYAYFGCSDSRLGREVIASINANMDSIRGAAFAAYRALLDPATRALHEAHERVFPEPAP